MGVRIEYENGVVFDPSTISDELSEDAKRIIRAFSDGTIIVEDHMGSIKEYEDLINNMIDTMHFGYDHAEFRDAIVYYKFYRDDDEPRWLKFRHFIFNLIMWYPFAYIKALGHNIKFTDDMIITELDMPSISVNSIIDYNNRFYAKPFRNIVDSRHLSRALTKNQFLLTKIPHHFSKFIGISINVEMFMKLAEESEQFDRLLHFQLDETKQPAEIEKDAIDACTAHRKLIMDSPYWNNLKAIMQDVKFSQLGEVQTVIALKPDENAKTIPIPINTNYITGNLASLVKYYINNISGRKAAILNNEYMGTAGYFLIMVTISTTSVKLSKTTMDCNTVNPIIFEVKTKKHLEKISGRRYKLPGQKKYSIVDSDKDDFLVGQTIYMRSPMTCACKDGICRECYGELYNTNISLNSAGAFAAVEVMNPVAQGVLSAKHSQGTTSHMIQFQPEFDRFFTISSTDILINSDAEDLDEYSIMIRREDFMSSDPDDDENDNLFSKFQTTKPRKRRKTDWDDDDDISNFGGGDGEESAVNLQYYVNKFYVVRNLNNPKRPQERILLSDADNKDLFFHTDLLNRMTIGTDSDGEYMALGLDNISLEEFVARVDVENNELTRPLKQIEKLVDTKQHMGCDTIDEMAQKMTDLLIESKISAVSVHGEMVMVKLVRRSDDILRRPNFSRIVMRPDYELLTIKTSLKKDPSITTSLSTPYLKYQLVTDQSTFDKTALSDFDPMYKLVLVGNDKRGMEYDRMTSV